MRDYTYQVTWSEEDQEFVGRCLEFPSLSFLGDGYVVLPGIRKLVWDMVADLRKNGEVIPEPRKEGQ